MTSGGPATGPRPTSRWWDDPSIPADVLRCAQRYLRYGTRSTHELRAYLESRRLPRDVSESVITSCLRRGWVDDRACASLWVTTLSERGYAWTAIRQRLLAKGLEPSLVSRTLEPLQAGADDGRRARLAVDAYRRRHPKTDRRDRHRLARLLSRRGFDADLIEQVLVESLRSPADAS